MIGHADGGNPDVAWSLRGRVTPDKIPSILDQLSRQTSLSFRSETREMDIWFLEPVSADMRPGDPK